MGIAKRLVRAADHYATYDEVDALRAKVVALEAERDEARAEVERLKRRCSGGHCLSAPEWCESCAELLAEENADALRAQRDVLTAALGHASARIDRLIRIATVALDQRDALSQGYKELQ